MPAVAIANINLVRIKIILFVNEESMQRLAVCRQVNINQNWFLLDTGILKSEQMNQIACTATETSAEGFIRKLLVDLQKIKKIDKIEFINRKLGLILAFTMSYYNN